MLAYAVRRLLWGLAVLAAIALVTFFLTYVLPADPARLAAGGGCQGGRMGQNKILPAPLD